VSGPLAPEAPQPVLRVERLVLRPFELRDAPAVQRLAGAREVADTTLNIPHPYPDGGAELWIATHQPAWVARERVVYAVTDAGSDELRGAIGLELSMRNMRAELGYWIGLPFWNCGYCTEAARALLEFGFETLGLHRIQARHLTRNPASGRVMQKVGMTLEGVNRDAFYRREQWESVAMYGILRDDWLATRTAGGALT
jgi:RimJ/RimL family protein N-acetyltransferase